MHRKLVSTSITNYKASVSKMAFEGNSLLEESIAIRHKYHGTCVEETMDGTYVFEHVESVHGYFDSTIYTLKQCGRCEES